MNVGVVVAAVVASLGQRGAPDAQVGEIVVVGIDAGDEVVLRPELPVDFGVADPELLLDGHGLEQRRLHAGGVDHDGVDDVLAVDGAVLERGEEV